jgi:DNA mismatch endonuclease, patch repair protein
MMAAAQKRLRHNGGEAAGTDIYPPWKRREIMSRVRSRDTQPEVRVRSLLHQAGYRFRLHRRDLPGCPDIVLPKHKVAVFVHGCFWHQHPGCKKASLPTTNKDFWAAKLAANVQRDLRVQCQLTEIGWRVVTVWECESRSGIDLLLNELEKATR